MKYCKHCDTTKSKSEYHKKEKGLEGLDSMCKECKKEKARGWRYRSLYGISVAEYDLMFEKQDGRCAICGTDSPGRGKRTMCIDHCHTTGEVRGLLCHSCNVALGHFRDNKGLLLRAVDYLGD